MPAGFHITPVWVKGLVADIQANEKFCLSPAYQEQEACRARNEGCLRNYKAVLSI